ncbi:hypothetical protein BAU15_06770 [Enterococcus sp. JM4C]|uniref:hypothetical protein n=1 Tax=Candidatus Enterococcus huntleyi TaxID=1857217 RepID=UPI0013793DAA|nr:hypothetical protein [Enterococcus sp. JM4C]KAF1297245.1 hypothetical protein BAU15_06770 [Enterococcus sp. JM4C]
MKKIVKENMFVIFIAFFYFIIGALIPLSGDDWTWAGQTGLDRLSIWFDNYNGRYLGNIIEMLITRFWIIRVIFYTIINTGIFVLIKKIIGEKSFLFNACIMALILAMPIDIYRQTYGWFAGFSNYNVSIFSTLLTIVILKKYTNNKVQPLMQMLFFCLFFLQQLIVEHMTLYNVLLAGFVVVYTLIKKEKVSLLKYNLLVASILGAATMFSNSVYLSIINHTDSYRTIGTTNETLFSKVYHTITQNWMNLVITNNWLINIILSILVTITILKYTKKYTEKKYLIFIPSFLFVFSFWSFFKSVGRINSEFFGKYFLLLESIAAIMFMLLIAIAIFICIEKKETKIELLFYGFSAIICVLPFLILEPLGPRCILSSYIYYILLSGKLASYNTLSLKIEGRFSPALMYGLKLALSAVILTLFLGYSIISYKNLRVSLTRVQDAEYSASNDTLVIKRLPFEQYTQHGSPFPNSVQENTFKQQFNIPKERKIIFVNYTNKVY